MLGFTSTALWMLFASFVMALLYSNGIHGNIGIMTFPYTVLFFIFTLVTYTGHIPPVASLGIAILMFIYYGRSTRTAPTLPNSKTWAY